MSHIRPVDWRRRSNRDRRTTPLGLRVLLIAAALIAAGCGSSDPTTTVVQTAPVQTTSTSTPAPSGPTRAEFVSQADAICEDINQQIQADPDRYDQLVDRGIGELEDLDVPEALQLRWNQYLAAVRDEQALFAQGREAEAQRARDRKSEIALQIGFAECGTG